MYQVLVSKEDGNTFAANVTEDQYGFLTSDYFCGFSVTIYSNKASNESHGKYGRFKTYKELIRWLSCADNNADLLRYEGVVETNFHNYLNNEKVLRTCKYILTYEYNSSGQLLESLFEKIKDNLVAYIHLLNAKTREKCRECVRLAMRDYIHAN